jgi:hypothetical protein
MNIILTDNINHAYRSDNYYGILIVCTSTFPKLQTVFCSCLGVNIHIYTKVDFVTHPDTAGNFLMKSDTCCSVCMYREIIYVVSQSTAFLLCMTIILFCIYSDK